MKIRILKGFDRTGIHPDDYSIGDIVEATKDSYRNGYVLIPIPIPGSTSAYLLLPGWYEVVVDAPRPLVEQSIDRYDS